MKSANKSIEFLQKSIRIFEKSEEQDSYINAYIILKNVYLLQDKPEMGIHSLNQAMDLILKFRSEMGKDKEAFTERFLDVFRELKKLYLESEQFDRALEVSEKMRGLSVSENFNLKYALSHGGVDSEKGAKLLKLKSELEALASERIVAKHQGDKGKKRENALSFRKEELESYEKTEGHLEKDGFSENGRCSRTGSKNKPSGDECLRNITGNNTGRRRNGGSAAGISDGRCKECAGNSLVCR